MTRKIRLGLVVVFVVLGQAAMAFSSAGVNEKTGVLVLAHGGSVDWNRQVHETTALLRQSYPVEIAFGMADPKTMQSGIDKLEERGVGTIVVVQLFISSFSPIIRQNEYLLGLRDKLADPPMLMSGPMMMGGARSSASTSSSESPPTSLPDTAKKKVVLKPLNVRAKIILTRPLDDHPMVVKTLLGRIRELSRRPEKETVVIVAHGPNDEADNRNWIKAIDNIADGLRTLQSSDGKPFKQIFGLTVRDDADEAIYKQAKEHLRTLVSQSGRDGDVIVIPLLLSQGGVERRIVERLQGLDYKWSGKTLLPHANLSKFLELTVKETLDRR